MFEVIVFVAGFVSGGALIWFWRSKVERAVVIANEASAKIHTAADSAIATAKDAANTISKKV